MLKKISALIIVLCLCFSITGCGMGSYYYDLDEEQVFQQIYESMGYAQNSQSVSGVSLSGN